jgi:hypothetical protein
MRSPYSPLALLLGLVPVLGLVELGLHQYFASRAPGFEDYRALAPELLKLKPSGAPVVVAPAWAEPLVRQAAPAAFPESELTRPDDSGFASFVEVSLLGASAPELAGFAVQRTQRIGKFQVSLRQNPRPEPVGFDFVSAFENGFAEIFSELDGTRRPCPLYQRSRAQTGGLHGHVAYPRVRHECEGGQIVAVSLIEDRDYRPHRCVLTQLPDSGSVVLRFSGVPASARFVGFVGFSYFLERDFEADEVALSVTEAGRPLGEERAAGTRGWSRFEVARPGAPGVVEVSVRRLLRSNSDFCFALEAR